MDEDDVQGGNSMNGQEQSEQQLHIKGTQDVPPPTAADAKVKDKTKLTDDTEITKPTEKADDASKIKEGVKEEDVIKATLKKDEAK